MMSLIRIRYNEGTFRKYIYWQTGLVFDKRKVAVLFSTTPYLFILGGFGRVGSEYDVCSLHPGVHLRHVLHWSSLLVGSCLH